jgi:opacity protein-like surface antigen
MIIETARSRMRHTIPQRAAAACLLLLIACASAAAQESPAPADDPFAARRWHFEGTLHGALETWNYNVSHEELYGLTEGLTYGLKDGVVLTIDQHIYYVSQRANDSWLLGLTCGFRGRVYRRGRSSVFIDGAVGISDAAIAAPPRGTRFNYLAMGSGGVLVRVGPRVHALAAIQWIHVSNNSLKGPGRNPDTEAVGPRIGVVIGF